MRNGRLGPLALMCLPFLLMASGAGFYLTDIYLPGARLQSELDRARAANVAVTPEEFLPDSLGDGVSEIGDQLKPLAEIWKKLDGEKQMELQEAIYELSTPEGRDASGRVEEIHLAKRIVEQWLQLSAKSEFGLKRDWVGKETILEPHYHAVASTARLAGNYAIVQANHGHYKFAFDILNATRKNGATYARHGGLDALALHVSMETQALESAENILLSHGKNAVVMNLYKSWIADDKHFPQLVAACEGEAMRSIFILSHPDNYRSQKLYGSRIFLRGNALRVAAATRISAFWREYLPAARKNQGDVYSIRDEFATHLSEFTKRKSPSKMLPASLLTWCGERIEAAAALRARYELAHGFAIVHSYRNAHGKLPDSVSDFKGLPQDPYSGETIKYARQEGGIYSLFRRLGSN
ncbi:hypothetical protein QPK87_31915 [Kamptonema cortianum]|nr:hypothetical protein [Kamptonema cortianum]